jgi:formate/nitrite transporter FocA (FNT family)
MNKWNVMRFAAYGALAGGLYFGARDSADWSQGPEAVAHALGAVVGGVIGGALIVGLVAFLRNRLLR